MAGLHIKAINKSYGSAHVLSDINLAIEDGEFLVLVGPSGCGKSTLLRMIAGLDAPTSGDIFIGNRLVNALAPAERKIAMVFQSYALYPHMDVRKNMTFGLKFTGVEPAEREKRVAEAARMLRLEELLQRYPRDLSGGQRQRVAIGRAIVREPDVFLFDEPLSNLDAALRVSTRVEIARLHRLPQSRRRTADRNKVESPDHPRHAGDVGVEPHAIDQCRPQNRQAQVPLGGDARQLRFRRRQLFHKGPFAGIRGIALAENRRRAKRDDPFDPGAGKAGQRRRQ